MEIGIKSPMRRRTNHDKIVSKLDMLLISLQQAHNARGFEWKLEQKLSDFKETNHLVHTKIAPWKLEGSLMELWMKVTMM